MAVITTTYKTNAKGTGQIVAKGGGKQRTINYDHSKSVRENHREAAGALAGRLGKSLFPHTEAIRSDNGTATFRI